MSFGRATETRGGWPVAVVAVSAGALAVAAASQWLRTSVGLVPGSGSGDLLAARLAVELGATAALSAPFLALSRLARARGGRGQRGIALGFLLVAAGYLLLSAVDAELWRYSGQRLRAVLLGAYSLHRGVKMTWNVVAGDARFVLAAVAVLVLVAVVVHRQLVRRPSPAPASWAVGALALAVPGLASPWLTGLGIEERLSIRPAALNVLLDLWRAARPGGGVGDPATAIRRMGELLGKPPGWFADPAYPLWHAVPDEEAAYAAFRARPLSERPDVVLVVLESAQAWELRFEEPTTESKAPALTRLFRERGLSFNRHHSSGYPSIEGWAGINFGLWCHPNDLILGRLRDRRYVGVADVLGRAGYHRILVSGRPDWENVEPFYERWYDRRFLDFDLTWDGGLVEPMKRLYDEAPPDRPRLLTIMTISTHPPFSLPPGRSFPASSGLRERYMLALAHLDDSLGRMLDHVRASGRWDRTVVVCVGDHSIMNEWMSLRSARIGTPNAGETWTTLLLAAPGFPGGRLDERLASHVDVAPTILGLLGLDVSNHFLGRDLLEPGIPDVPAVAAHLGGVGYTEGPFRLQFRLSPASSLRKFEYAVLERPETDPEVGPDYRHGREVVATPADAARAAAVREVLSAYGDLISRDRVAPPGPGPRGPGSPRGGPAD